MADRRGVRSSSRRIAPTPQPPSTANTPQAARASRRRGTRSASREVEQPAPPPKSRSTRRGTRQASVTSESGAEGNDAPAITRKRRKPDVGDLTTVEEADSQIVVEDAAGTPPRPQTQKESIPDPSPGAVSEMSGTTAISSLSQFEAEDLESKWMLRRLRDLYRTSEEFLAHLVPDAGRIEHDATHIQEMQKPDSEFNEDFRLLEKDMNLHLSHFKGRHSQYINVRAVHRALLGPDRDPASLQSPLDVLLHKANLLVFTKQGISLDRPTEEAWSFLQYHDKFFPATLLSALGSQDEDPTPETTALARETFELALELRTQLLIVALEREANKSVDGYFNPDKMLLEAFFGGSDEPGEYIPHGWDVPGLAGRDSQLTGALGDKVVERAEEIRKYFPVDSEALAQGETVNFEDLTAEFSFQAFVLQLLDWARLRNREIERIVRDHGGVAKIAELVKHEIDHPHLEQPPLSVLVATPRKKRVSFGRDRKRSSRIFDPNAPLDEGVLDALIAKQQGQEVRVAKPIEPTEAEMEEDVPVQVQEDDEWQPMPNDELDEPDDSPVEAQPIEPDDEPVEEQPSTVPPRSTADYTRLFKESRKLDKENRGTLFAAQTRAERVEFGDGFDDTQATPGPSSRAKGKQPQRPSPRKRRRPVEDEDSEDSDDDAFETEESFETERRNAQAQKRREEAPLPKRVRIDPSSSAPTSHQPRARPRHLELLPEEPESLSEQDAPEMTEVPPSSYREVTQLAKIAQGAVSGQKSRKTKVPWSAEAEEVFQDLMAKYPRKYARILQEDKDQYGQLQDRTQINLKDKARTMAENMIKSGTGLKPGFEDIVTPTNTYGKKLIEDGYEW
ncbi:hypothetical protein BDV96DRAFT_499223 [Lophiotrema nucula]|uniref:Myb-like domain-containing protein n=1 Tax=Lophiotrema nucula TaxID=690887 RepID=A0A6A5YWY1_9PLEO|nr:hypothetical protein BDV96DRAFT_499223 [Lophiotrema nucula]